MSVLPLYRIYKTGRINIVPIIAADILISFIIMNDPNEGFDFEEDLSL